MIDHIATKNTLESLLMSLSAELATIAVHNPETDDWEAKPEHNEESADENAAADVTEEWTERSGTVAALETEYRATKRALARIAAGTYGTCEICGEEILPARLAIKPSARTCIAHLDDEATLPL